MVNDNENEDLIFDLEKLEDTITDEPELEDIEEAGADKLKKLRTKLKTAEEEKRAAQDELQRARADFPKRTTKIRGRQVKRQSTK